MPEEVIPGETPPEPPAGETPPGQPGELGEPGGPGEPRELTREALQAELESAKAALKRVNAESAKRRKQLEAHETAEKKRKEDDLSEVEKAQAGAKDWENKYVTLSKELKAAQMRQAFYDETDVQKLSFVNVQAEKDAYTLADISSVVTDEDGMTGMVEAVKALVKSHPHLFGTAQPPKDINALDTGKGKGKATEAQMMEYAARVGIDVKYLDPALVAQTMQ